MFEVAALLENSWVRPETGNSWNRQNPFDLSQNICSWNEDTALVERAVETGHKAFELWKQSSLPQRASLLEKLASHLEKMAPDIEDRIVFETGKARWEARAESKALASKIRLSLEKALPLFQSLEEACSIEGKQELRFLPRGLCAVLGPFNFPLHLANGHIAPALLAGNTVIFKASEYSAACATLYAEAFLDAGFPSGVFQMIPGGADTGRALVENQKVKAVFFTGSFENGKRITKSLLDHRKDLSTLAALELGGKNACIIFEDSDYEKALSESLLSAYATAGQRCSCASRIFVQKSLLDKFQRDFLSNAKDLAFGNPDSEETFAGSMIHPQAVEQFLKGFQNSTQEGFELLLEAKQTDSNSCLVSPGLLRSHEPEKDVFKENLQKELFGPSTTLIPFEDVEQVVGLHEAAEYGLVSSVFTKDRELFEKVSQSIEVGLLNWNRATVGASSSLPFGGMKKSGNNWPAGIFSYYYCVYPRAYLLDDSAFDFNSLPKNLQRTWSLKA